MLQEVSEEAFADFVQTKKVVLVHFTTDRDPTSQVMEAVLESDVLPAVRRHDDAALVKIDMDKHPRMQAYFEIIGGTTVVMFVDGQWAEFSTPQGSIDRFDVKSQTASELLLQLLEQQLS